MKISELQHASDLAAGRENCLRMKRDLERLTVADLRLGLRGTGLPAGLSGVSIGLSPKQQVAVVAIALEAVNQQIADYENALKRRGIEFTPGVPSEARVVPLREPAKTEWQS